MSKSNTILKRFVGNYGYETVMTPENAPLECMQFGRLMVKEGTSESFTSEDHESAFVIMSGKVKVTVEYEGKTVIEESYERKCVFTEKPYAVYLPPKAKLTVVAETEAEFRAFLAPAEGKNPPFFCKPDDVEEGTPGAFNWRRKYRFIFGPVNRANGLVTEKLIVGESVSRPGGWIGFPGHKHDVECDTEYPLDEIFSFKVKGPKGGYVFAMSYEMEPEKWSDVYIIEDDNYAMGIGKGLHTSLAAPGCTEYLFWGLGGKDKVYKLTFDSRFSWMDDSEYMEPQF